MKIGSQNIQKLYSGSQEIVKAYLGRDVIYENTPPTPPGPANGVYILYTDGSYSAYDTLDAGKTPVGPLLITDNVSLIIHPTEASNDKWSTDESIEVAGVTTASNASLAKLDFSGENNTSAVMAAGVAGAAFSFAASAVYTDGRHGFLPSCGQLEEIRQNATGINIAFGLIGGTAIDFSAKNYWSSTQTKASQAWGWYGSSYNNWYGTAKSNILSSKSVSTYLAG